MVFRVKAVVSLGAWCQTTYQARRFFGNSVTSPYDWLVTPFNALLASIEGDGLNFCKHLRVVDASRPICEDYGILYHHEFERRDEHAIITASAIERCSGKLSYKYIKMIECASTEGTLFIRLGGQAEPAFAWPYLNDTKPLQAREINALCNIIEKKFAIVSFRLLLVFFAGRTAFDMDSMVDDRVIIRELPHAAENGKWEGCDEEWDMLLNDLNLDFSCIK